MNIKILNDIYEWVVETCAIENDGLEIDKVYHCNGQFAQFDGGMYQNDDDWEEIDLGLVANRVMEHINSKGYEKTYLYVCRDDAYVCIEDPNDIDSDSMDCFDEYESGLFVGVD